MAGVRRRHLRGREAATIGSRGLPPAQLPVHDHRDLPAASPRLLRLVRGRRRVRHHHHHVGPGLLQPVDPVGRLRRRAGFPVSLASSATAVFFVAGGIGGMIAGRLVDRIDARVVIVVAASIGALALACRPACASCGSSMPSMSCSAFATAPAGSCP